MNLIESSKIVLTFILAQKWNEVVAKDELKDAVFKIHSVAMGESNVFHFTATLPSGRVHSVKIMEGMNIEHKIL